VTSVVKSTPFEADFAQCALYLSEANPSAALHFVDAVERAIGLVASFPDLGPVWRYGPRKHSTRFLLVPGFHNYLTFYRHEGGEIRLGRLLHGAQDLRDLLED
jgi:plasmid stabilization system protein ParE